MSQTAGQGRVARDPAGGAARPAADVSATRPASTSPGSAAATSGRCPPSSASSSLLIVFSALRPETFTNSFNFANLLIQSAPVIVIAMGLVFVLLIGEIDLSAGYTAGVAGRDARRRRRPATTSRGGSASSPAWPPAPVIGPGHRPPGRPGGHPVLRRHPGRLPRASRACCCRSSARAARSGSRARRSSRSCRKNLPVWLGWTLYVVLIAGLRRRHLPRACRPAGPAGW